MNKQINVLFTNRICTKTNKKNKCTKSMTWWWKEPYTSATSFRRAVGCIMKSKGLYTYVTHDGTCDCVTHDGTFLWAVFSLSWAYIIGRMIPFTCTILVINTRTYFLLKNYQQLITFIYVILSIHIRDYSYSVLNFTIQIISLLLKLYYMSSVMK